MFEGRKEIFRVQIVLIEFRSGRIFGIFAETQILVQKQNRIFGPFSVSIKKIFGV